MSRTSRKSRQIQRWIEANLDKVHSTLPPYCVQEFEGELFGEDAYQHCIELSDEWIDPITEISTVMETSVEDAMWHLKNLTQKDNEP